MWDIAKAMPRGKFIALNAYIKMKRVKIDFFSQYKKINTKCQSRTEFSKKQRYDISDKKHPVSSFGKPEKILKLW